eukprot:m.39932 g.39932  ORF g.39932 m.39932 type:complete len:174 (+) comp11669_c0_seq2:564-1085(+)
MLLDTLMLTYQHVKFGDQRGRRNMTSLLRGKLLLLIHHVAVMLAVLPLIVFVRKGDYFFGHFFLCEISSIFLMLRGGLLDAKMQQSTSFYIVNIIFVCLFFWSRIWVFPRMFADYGASIGVAWYDAPFRLPIYCRVGSSLFLIPQLWWFSSLVRSSLSRRNRPLVSEKHTKST